MPKSSIARRSPIACRSPRTAGASASMIASSVSSRISEPAAIPQDAVSFATVSGRSLVRVRLRAEMFTAIETSMPASRQALCWRSASSSTQWVRGAISSPLAVSGRKLSGINSPSVGWFQRTSASTPVVRRVVRSTFGW